VGYGEGACPLPIKLTKKNKKSFEEQYDKNKLECNHELLSACIFIATSATENKNRSVRFVNIGHFAIKFDISFDNGSDEDMFD